MMKYLLNNKVMAVDPDSIKLPDYINGDSERATNFSLESVMFFIKEVKDIAYDIVIIVGVFFILYASFLYLTAYGDESKAETAKKTLIWSMIGTFVAFLAKTIADNLDKILSN